MFSNEKVASNDALLESIRSIGDTNFVEALCEEIEENGLTFAERAILSKVTDTCLRKIYEEACANPEPTINKDDEIWSEADRLRKASLEERLRNDRGEKGSIKALLEYYDYVHKLADNIVFVETREEIESRIMGDRILDL